MQSTLKEKIVASLAAPAGAYSCFALFMTCENGPAIWRILAAVLFVLWMISLWKLLQRRRWAFWSSLILAVAALGLGVYYVSFAWNFWIFREPTLRDRLLAVLNPRIFILAAWPLLWCGYLFRAGFVPDQSKRG